MRERAWVLAARTIALCVGAALIGWVLQHWVEVAAAHIRVAF